jgi:hypothetical protein
VGVVWGVTIFTEVREDYRTEPWACSGEKKLRRSFVLKMTSNRGYPLLQAPGVAAGCKKFRIIIGLENQRIELRKRVIHLRSHLAQVGSDTQPSPSC